MAFMEGFGSAFARSFELGNERRAQMENDAFKMAYSDYIDRKNDYKKQESEWKKATDAGNLLAQRYGAPPEAGLKAAEWLMAGYSESYVDEMLRKTKFSVTPSSDNPDRVNTLDTQMSDSGLSGTPETPDPTAMPTADEQGQNQGLLANNVFGPGGLFPNAGKSTADRAQQRVQDTLGIDQEEFNRVNQGFQRPEIPAMTMEPNGRGEENDYTKRTVTQSNLNAAKTELAQLRRNPQADQNRIAYLETLIPDMEAAMVKDVDPLVAAEAMRAVTSTQKQRQELSDARTGTLDAARAAKDIIDIVESTNGKVLTLTAAGANLADTIITEGKTIFDFITGGDPNARVTENQMLGGLEQYVREHGASDEYRMYKAKEIRFIFALAKAQGMSGNGMSDKDYTNLANSVFVGNRPEMYVNNMKGFITQGFDSVDRQARALGQLTEISDIGAKYFPSVLEATKPMKDYVAGTPDEELYNWAYSGYNGGPSVADDNSTSLPPQETIYPQESAPVEGNDSPENRQPGEIREDDDGNYWVFQGGDWNDKNNWRPLYSGE